MVALLRGTAATAVLYNTMYILLPYENISGCFLESKCFDTKV